MGAAKYVGRVGTLAVALGVGSAVAMGHGMAYADSPDSGSSDSSSSASTSKPSQQSSANDSQNAGTVSGGSTGSEETSASESRSSTTTTSDAAAVDQMEADPDDSASLPEPEPAPISTPEPDVEPESAGPPAQPDKSVSSKRSAMTAASVPDPEVSSSKTVTADQPADTFVQRTAEVEAEPRYVVSPTTATTMSVTPLITKAAAPTASTLVSRVEVAPPSPLSTVSGVVSGLLGLVMSPLAATNGPVTPVQPPALWAMLAWVRREFERAVSTVFGAPPASNSAVATEPATFALAAAAVNPRPGFPVPGAQLSPSTKFVDWVTGNFPQNNTFDRFGIWGTDVGVIWDNGMVDNPLTPHNERQVLMALGDTFSGPNMTGGWRLNTLLRSSDVNLADGMSVPNGEWFNGNMFGGAPLGNPTYARQIIHPAAGLPGGITLIPTAGISIPTPGTQFGVTQYVNFMSVTQWGAPGQWTTNYSAIAYSTDNGENWAVAPTSVRYNQPWSGNQNFQQGAFVRPGDGYVYMYGTPNGRQGAAYVSRVLEKDILNVTKYDYYSKGNPGGWFGWGSTPAGWYKNDPAAATPVFGQDQGACGVANPGNQVSEMSVQYNGHLRKYVTLYGDQFNNIVMRTADRPEGTWSTAKVLLPQQSGGIYAPMMHPWSPSTTNTGSDLYWNLSMWSEYNVMLMRTDLSKV